MGLLNEEWVYNVWWNTLDILYTFNGNQTINQLPYNVANKKRVDEGCCCCCSAWWGYHRLDRSGLKTEAIEQQQRARSPLLSLSGLSDRSLVESVRAGANNSIWLTTFLISHFLNLGFFFSAFLLFFLKNWFPSGLWESIYLMVDFLIFDGGLSW